MPKFEVAGKPGLDPTLPDVELVLEGKSYHLVYDFNAICMAEKVTGINLLSSVLGEVTGNSLRGLLWAALLRSHSEVTIDEVGALIKPENIADIREAIIRTWFGGMPEPDSAGEATARGD